MAEQLPLPMHARGSDTSAAAAASMAGETGRLRDLVLVAIGASGRDGLTADEAAERLGLSVLAVRPRATELKQSGEIRDSGMRRPNASGRKAAVWVTAAVWELLR